MWFIFINYSYNSTVISSGMWIRGYFVSEFSSFLAEGLGDVFTLSGFMGDFCNSIIFSSKYMSPKNCLARSKEATHLVSDCPAAETVLAAGNA